MTLKSEPLPIHKPVEYVHSMLRFVQMETDEKIIINGDQPTQLVCALGPVLAIVDIYQDYPRCVRCNRLVCAGRELLPRLISGEIGGVCHICDPGDWPRYRTHYYESRYEEL